MPPLAPHGHWAVLPVPGWARCQNDALGGLLVSAVPFRPTGTQAGSVTVPFCDFKVIQTHPLEILGARRLGPSLLVLAGHGLHAADLSALLSRQRHRRAEAISRPCGPRGVF